LLLKTRGRRHSPGERQLLQQVKLVFAEKIEKLGAKRAAEELNICLASIYKYAAGDDLPRIEVLRDAQHKWGVKWDLIDPSQLLRPRKVSSARQYALSFLETVRAQDVEVAKISPKHNGSLQILLQIRFPA
jgi:hypothetical protein